MAYELDVAEEEKPLKTKLFSILFFSFIFLFIVWNAYNYFETERLIDAQKQSLGEESVYSHQLPLAVLKEAEQYKNSYFTNRMADTLIDAEASDGIIKKSIIHEYEKAINALYAENIRNKDSLARILNLVTYVPDMFYDNPNDSEMAQLLKEHSPELLELTIHYKINAELNNPNNAKNTKEFSDLQKTIIAEQQAKILALNGKLSSLQRRETAYLKELEDLKNPKPLLEE